MRLFLMIAIVFSFASLSLNQDVSREQKFRQLKELNAQINKMAEELLLPDNADAKDAEAQGLKAFRLMPREVFSRQITVPQEGGAFYSFTTGSHDYQRIPQICLEQNYLSTGFAGADYGLIADLRSTPLSDINEKTPQVDFLLNYKRPLDILEARVEQRKSLEYVTDQFTLRRRFSALVGNSYVIRTIDWGNADVLVAFRVIRKDADGSLIIYWKQIAEFAKPTFDPNIKEN